ncbi:hypothetical protein [Phytohabitans suffuscus]|uniref:Uncharacterized protein n=1 Tax=Phytohabitans suffuscus TaxID=624315 RepID=A0A6F8YRC8_9ACTN|nr:hypothetical protein [Phytohabitans suffuscus]BCB88478.1 hypothetical protein Psuf_057910 [Phytohabitans suffuscus]
MRIRALTALLALVAGVAVTAPAQLSTTGGVYGFKGPDPDGNTWTSAYSTTTGDGGTDDVAASGTGRYLRVLGTQRATQWGYSLRDLNAYGT